MIQTSRNEDSVGTVHWAHAQKPIFTCYGHIIRWGLFISLKLLLFSAFYVHRLTFHALHQLHSKEMKMENRWWRTNAILTPLCYSCIFLLHSAARHAECNNFCLSSFFISFKFDSMRLLLLFFLNVVPLLSIKEIVLRHVREK